MNKEDKIYLIKSLALHYPYGVQVDLNGIRGKLNDLQIKHIYHNSDIPTDLEGYINFFQPNEPIDVQYFKPLLRSFSDITKEEYAELQVFSFEVEDLIDKKLVYFTDFFTLSVREMFEFIQWCCMRHFDITGLLDKNLAIEVKYKDYFL